MKLNARRLRLLLAVLLLCSVAAWTYMHWESWRDYFHTPSATRKPGGPALIPGENKLTIVERAARRTLPDVPAIALVNLIPDDGRPIHRRGSEQLTALLQASLSDSAHYRWVERNEIDRAIDELSLLPIQQGDVVNQLRIGQWTRANLLLRGRIKDAGRPAQSVTLELVNLANADVVADTTIAFPHAIDGIDDVPDDAIAAMKAAAIDTIMRGTERARATENITTIAPLFIRNISSTNRLGTIRELSAGYFAESASAIPGWHVLRFSAVNETISEEELSLFGLVHGNADTWQTIADVYVWGTVEEMPIVSGEAVAFEDLRIQLKVHAWNGLDETQVYAEQVTVRELPEAYERILAGLAEFSRKAHSSQVSLTRRDTLVDELRAAARRMRDALVAGGHKAGAPMSDQQKQVAGYINSQLEMACFLSPESTELRWELLDFQRSLPRPRTFPDAHDRLMLTDRFMQQFARTNPQSNTFDKAVRAYTDDLSAAFDQLHRLMKSPDAGGSLTIEEAEWANHLYVQSARFAQRMADVQQDYPTAGLHALRGGSVALIDVATRVPGDPECVIAHIDAWWPFVRQRYGTEMPKRNRTGPWRELENRLWRIYSGADREDDLFQLLLSRDSERAVPGPSASQPDNSIQQAIQLAQSRIAATQQPGQSYCASLNLLVKASATESVDRRALDGVAKLVLPARPLFVGGAEIRKSASRDQQWAIHDIAESGGRIWCTVQRGDFGSSAAPPSTLMAYEPASDSWIDASAVIGTHSAINGIAARGNEVWIATTGDGLLRLAARDLHKEVYSTNRGLKDTNVRSVAVRGNDLLASTASLALSILPNNESAFLDYTPRISPELQQANYNAQRIGTASIISRGDWVITETGTPLMLDKASGQWQWLQTSIGRRLPGMQEMDGRWQLQAIALGEGVMAFVSGGQVVHFTAATDQVYQWQLPQVASAAGNAAMPWTRFPSRMACDGDFIWLAYDADSPARSSAPGESLLLLGHAPTQKWIGYFDVAANTINAIHDGPAQIWIGIDSPDAQLLAVDKRILYRQVQPDWRPPHHDAPEPDEDDRAPFTGATRLMRAAYAGDAHSVQALLAAEASLEAADNGSNALYAAIAGGRDDIMQMLLDADRSGVLLQNNHTGIGPVHLAAAFGDPDILRLLLDRSPDTAAPADILGTPLCAAVTTGNVENARLLLRNGASLERPSNVPGDGHGVAFDPLVQAVRVNSMELFTLLCDEVAARDTHHIGRFSVALSHAIRHDRQEMIDDLLARGADPNWQQPGEQIPLVAAVQVGRHDLISLMLQHGGDIRSNPAIVRGLCRCANEFSLVALFDVLTATGTESSRKADEIALIEAMLPIAIKDQKVRMVQVLVGRLQQPDEMLGGIRPVDATLILFAFNRDLAGVMAMIEEGANINATDDLGSTALHYAARQNYGAMVWFLLQNGADADLANADGQRAGDLAGDQRTRLLLPKREITDGAHNAWVSNQLAARAIAAGDAALVARHLDSGAEVDGLSADGWPLIVLVSYHRQPAIVQTLVDRHADVNAVGPAGWSALMQASRIGDVLTVEQLVQAKANLQALNDANQTALDLALLHQRDEVAGVLVRSGAMQTDGRPMIRAVKSHSIVNVRNAIHAGEPVDGVDAEGRTALFYAIDGKSISFGTSYRGTSGINSIELLLRHGANANHSAYDGSTPLIALMNAQEVNDKVPVAALLLRYGADPTAKNAKGEDAMSLAQQLKSGDMRDRLLKLLTAR